MAASEVARPVCLQLSMEPHRILQDREAAVGTELRVESLVEIPPSRSIQPTAEVTEPLGKVEPLSEKPACKRLGGNHRLYSLGSDQFARKSRW